MPFIDLIIIVILFLYIFLIIRYAFGWINIRNISIQNYSPKVSVVIALRNEESQIDNLLKCLKYQVYPIDKLEFILVNDHSTDQTRSLLENLHLYNLQVLNLPTHKSGKKDAISTGVSIASGDIILVSDADCSFTPNWVGSMVNCFANDDIKLVSGPVSFNKQKGVFQSLQTLEFASLVGSGAGAIGINNAIFCNGANMAYKREVFLELNSFEDDSTASGDDVFLLHDVKAKYPNSIAFAKNKDAIVLAKSMQNFNNFINQRKRWVAKSSGYKDIESICISYLVFFTNFSFIFLFFTIFFNISVIHFFMLFYVLKFSADLFLLLPLLSFFNRKDLIKWIFPFELVYSFYIILIVFLSFTKKFEWKERIHNK